MLNTDNKYSSGFSVTLTSLSVMLLWGLLFPLVKIGYKVFETDLSSVPDILMFAGARFAVCGLLLTLLAVFRGQRLSFKVKSSLLPTALTGVFAVLLHYAFTYVGLSVTDSGKAAILKQTGVLFYICFSFLFIKSEKFSVQKLIGALLGFCGIMAINGGGLKSGLTYGDVLILMASVCTVASNITVKSAMKQNSPLTVTGTSQLFGGALLIICALIGGARFPKFTVTSTAVFAVICAASMLGYTLWYSSCNKAELSGLFIIKFAEPIFASIFGALLLKENIFRLSFLFSFLLISLGITVADGRLGKLFLKNKKNNTSNRKLPPELQG